MPSEASGVSLTRLTPGRGDRRHIGFSSPPLSKGRRRALGCLRGTDLRKIDRRLHCVVHENSSTGTAQSARTSRQMLPLSAAHPGVILGVGTPPRASMTASRTPPQHAASGRLNGPAGSARSPLAGLRQVRRDVAMRGKAVVAPVRLRHRQRDSVPGLHVQSLRQRLHQASPAARGRSG